MHHTLTSLIARGFLSRRGRDSTESGAHPSPLTSAKKFKKNFGIFVRVVLGNGSKCCAPASSGRPLSPRHGRRQRRRRRRRRRQLYRGDQKVDATGALEHGRAVARRGPADGGRERGGRAPAPAGARKDPAFHGPAHRHPCGLGVRRGAGAAGPDPGRWPRQAVPPRSKTSCSSCSAAPTAASTTCSGTRTRSGTAAGGARRTLCSPWCRSRERTRARPSSPTRWSSRTRATRCGSRGRTCKKCRIRRCSCATACYRRWTTSAGRSSVAT